MLLTLPAFQNPSPDVLPFDHAPEAFGDLMFEGGDTASFASVATGKMVNTPLLKVTISKRQSLAFEIVSDNLMKGWVITRLELAATREEFGRISATSKGREFTQ